MNPPTIVLLPHSFPVCPDDEVCLFFSACLRLRQIDVGHDIRSANSSQSSLGREESRVIGILKGVCARAGVLCCTVKPSSGFLLAFVKAVL